MHDYENVSVAAVATYEGQREAKVLACIDVLGAGDLALVNVTEIRERYTFVEDELSEQYTDSLTVSDRARESLLQVLSSDKASRHGLAYGAWLAELPNTIRNSYYYKWHNSFVASAGLANERIIVVARQEDVLIAFVSVGANIISCATLVPAYYYIGRGGTPIIQPGVDDHRWLELGEFLEPLRANGTEEFGKAIYIFTDPVPGAWVSPAFDVWLRPPVATLKALR